MGWCRRGRGRAPHGLDELTIGGVGQHEPDRSRSERLGRERLVHVHRGDHDLGAGRRRAQSLDPLGAEPVRHPQVEHEHVGVLDGHLVHGGLEVARLADDVQITLVVQQPPQAPAQTGMVVGEHDTGPRFLAWAVGIAIVDWV